MNTAFATSDYVLGGSDQEHDRLMRQAATLAPYTERLFRDAGIGPGQHVLDVGCGVGDVALIAAGLVGETGSVVGIDRDANALAKARARAAAARAANVRFVQTDLSDLRVEGEFDAVLGRFVLMFLPDPAATVRALASHLRPGGVIVFQEPSWNSFFAQATHLPLRTACGELLCEALRRAGSRPNMELTLYRILWDMGFEAPRMHVEIPIASDAEGRRWIYDLLVTVRARFEVLKLTSEMVGEFDTLAGRLEAELETARSYAPLVGLVGAWATKPRR